MAIKFAINGFGRIGRQTLRALIEKTMSGEISNDEIELVAINDLTDTKTLAHLLKYDSNYGILESKVSISENSSSQTLVGEIAVEDIKFNVYNEPDPAKLPWKKLGVDVVIESTGHFTDQDSASAHIKAGAKKVIISAPAKDKTTKTYIVGVNSDKIPAKESIISNASCTTNCIAPIMAILDEHFGIEKSFMTTVHAYTADQLLVDGPHHDLRRARAAASNTVPTTTGAAICTGEILPNIKGKFDGMSLRVPVAIGSISDIVALIKEDVTAEQINEVFIRECENPKWKGILTYTNEPLVSSDIIGNSHSAIVDLSLTQVVDKNLIKVIAWYDNEWGYSNRMIELIIQLGAHLK
jgi:glyceraldehyde 3-phosphate dehydrogenase